MLSGTWRNWSATVTATPNRTVRPRDADEAAAVISEATRTGRAVRPLGSGHSFTEIGAPTDIALDLGRWTGITRADRDTGLVTARAGTPLWQLNAELAELGLAMINLGDIDVQTLAGAISTGTHGTGAAFGGLATQVRGLDLVLADGSIRCCDATENPELFAAARLGLGAIGLISSVTLQCEPAFALAADERSESLDAVLPKFDELANANDHVEFYWFPHGSKALVKRNNRLPAGTPPRPLHPIRSLLEYEILENRAFGMLCRAGRQLPALVRPLNRLCGAAWSSRSYGDRSDRVFVTKRGVRFVESEYAIPRESLGAVFDQLRSAVGYLEHPVMFPVEVRVAAADEVWMSTAYGRPTAYVAVHQFAGMPYRHWFELFESIATAVGGRPHWGKRHRLEAAQLRELYPKFDDFRRVRADVDPHGTFDNPHLKRILDG